MTLKKLKITYQRHKNKIVCLDKFVTVFVGPTGSGKSSILRCLRWVCANKPKGNGFIPWDGDKAIGVLDVDNHVVVRKKSAKENYYKLDGRKLTAFGNTVPSDIVELLNVSSINFSTQHQPYFLFTKTDGEVAKELNSVVALDGIDKSLGKLLSWLKKAKLEVDLSREKLEGVSKKKNQLQWVKEADRCLRKVETSQEELQKISRQVVKLEELLKQIDKARVLKKKATKILPLGVKTLVSAEKLLKLREKREGLVNLLDRILKQKKVKIYTKKQLDVAIKEFEEMVKVENCPICGNQLFVSSL